MALQVWLPLTKDTRQQGLSSISVTGSPAAWNNGKLGKCAYWNGTAANVLYNNTTDFNYTNNFSVAFWANPVYTGLTVQYAWTVGRADAGGYGYGFQIINATTAYFRFGNGSYSVSAPSNEWHHFVMTVGNSKVTIYKDGSQVSSNNLPGTIPTYSDGNGMGLGCFHYSGNIYPYYGSLNDFRIYDHCLSPMEVKELSKGLVLHYPLNRQGWGQENLLLNSNDLTLWPIESSGKIELQEDGYFKVSSKASNTTRYGIYYDFTFPEPNTYTFSVDVRDDWLIGVAPASTFTWTTANLSGTQGKKRISYTCTSTEENNKCRIYIAGTGTGSRVTYLKQPKLEKGSIATPWCPNSSDTLATTMGLNGTTEYDCSGFCNNGEKVGTLTYNSDTAKYSVSTVFNGSAAIFKDNFNITAPFSACCWAKYNNFTNLWLFQHGTAGGYNSTQFGCHALTNGNGYGVIINTQYTAVDNLGSLSNWHHIAITFDGSILKVYFNGELKLTKTINSTAYNGTRISVGRYYSNTYYNGKASDFRIYATALSADDVKSLYQNSAYIDSSGNVYGAVHSEV